MLAVELADVVAPQRLHREHVLARDRAPVASSSTPWSLDLVLVPAEADAEHEAAARQLVERRDRLGGDDRLALRDEADAGADDEPLGRRPRPSPARRTGRACACTPRASSASPVGGGVRRLVGMCVCSGRYSESKPRSSAARANSSEPIVWSVTNIVTPKRTRVPSVAVGAALG